MRFFSSKKEISNPDVNGVKNQDLGSGKPLPRHIPYNERFPVQASGQQGWENGQAYRGTRLKPQLNVLGQSRVDILEQSAQADGDHKRSGAENSVQEKHRSGHAL